MKFLPFLLVVLVFPTFLSAQVQDKRLDYDALELESQLIFINKGVAAQYFVIIKGKTYKNPTSLAILPGKIHIEVYQNRMFRKVILLNKSYLINANSENRIVFTIPWLTGEEKIFVGRKDGWIDKNYSDSDKYDEVKSILKKMISNFSNILYNPKLISYKRKYQNLLVNLDKPKKIDVVEENPEVVVIEKEVNPPKQELIPVDIDNDKWAIYLGLSTSLYLYSMTETDTLWFGGGADFGFDILVKDNFYLGYFLSAIFEPSIFMISFGITPDFHFKLSNTKNIAMSFVPLELGLRFDYFSELQVVSGFSSSLKLDVGNGYFRLGIGGYLDDSLLFRFSGGYRFSYFLGRGSSLSTEVK